MAKKIKGYVKIASKDNDIRGDVPEVIFDFYPTKGLQIRDTITIPMVRFGHMPSDTYWEYTHGDISMEIESWEDVQDGYTKGILYLG